MSADTELDRNEKAKRELEHGADEMDERLEKLGAHIDDSKAELKTRQEDADPTADVAGDWEDTDDDAGGEDPAGFDDPEELSNDEEEDDEDE